MRLAGVGLVVRPDSRTDACLSGARGHRPYQWRAVGLDVASMIIAVSLATVIWDLALADLFNSALACAGLIAIWLAQLGLTGSYDARLIGRGIQEYQRVATAGLITLGIIAGMAFLSHQPVSRGFVIISLGLGMALMLLDRWACRVWLQRARDRGRYRRRTAVIGDPGTVDEVAAMLDGDVIREYCIVERSSWPKAGEDLDGWLDERANEWRRTGIDTVAVASGEVDPDVLSAVAWRLSGPGIQLLVSPALGRLVRSRIVVHQAAGVPFLSLNEPRLVGPQRWAKRAMDIGVSAVMLLALSPVLLACAIAVRLSGPGPIFYSQPRVGQGGRPFLFPKFRTMVDGADAMRDEVIGAPDADISDRYRADPRITGVGRVLRRWSLDELPQLGCVLLGAMSLVGPRPVLPDELDLIMGDDHGRHVAKPGLTGLWQVSGRKETTWEERMSFDLEYIERWSPMLDVLIILKTVPAVIRARGAF